MRLGRLLILASSALLAVKAGAADLKMTYLGARATCAARFPLCAQFEVTDSCASSAPRTLNADASAATSDSDPDYQGVPGVYRALADAGSKIAGCLKEYDLLPVKERYDAGLKSVSQVRISCQDSTGDATGTTLGQDINVSLGIVNKSSHLSLESILFHESFHAAGFPHGNGVDYTYFATSCCVETWSSDHGLGCYLLDQASQHLGEQDWWLTADYLALFARYLKKTSREKVLLEVLRAADQRHSDGVCAALGVYYGPLAQANLPSEASALAQKNACQ